MKKFILAIISLLLSSVVYANSGVASFNLQNPLKYGFRQPELNLSGGSTADYEDVPNGAMLAEEPIYFSVNSSAASTSTRFWGGNKEIDFRVYKNTKLTFASMYGDAIRKITFTGAAIKDMTFDTGYYDANKGIWYGDGKSVTITMTKTVRINTIDVAYDDFQENYVCAPIFTPEGGSYTIGVNAPVTVSLIAPTNGSKMYYSISGSDEQEYTAPFQVTNSCEISAYAICGDSRSDEAKATFNILAAPINVNSIAEVYTHAVNDGVTFANSVMVVYQSGSFLVVRDDTGSLMIDGDLGRNYMPGDMIPAGASGTLEEYGGVLQLRPNAESFKARVSTGTVPAPTEVDTYSVRELDPYYQRYVVFKSVEVVEQDSRRYAVNDEMGEFNLYNMFSIKMPKLEEGARYDVKGFATEYNGVQQVNIVSCELVERPAVVKPIIRPVTRTFMESLQVMITTETAGAKIWYSIDGDVYQEYTAPFYIFNSCMIQAYATKDENQSFVTEEYYTLLVPENEVYFDFTNPTTLSPAINPSKLELTGVDVGGTIFSSNLYTLEVTDGSANASRLWTKNAAHDFATELRMYKDATLVITAPAGYALERISLTGDKITSIECDKGDIANGQWYGNANSVTLKATGSLCINTIIIPKVVAQEKVLGDANKDGVVDVMDASLVSEYILFPELDVTDIIDLENADVNQDNIIDIADIVMICNIANQ